MLSAAAETRRTARSVLAAGSPSVPKVLSARAHWFKVRPGVLQVCECLAELGDIDVQRGTGLGVAKQSRPREGGNAHARLACT